MFLSAVSLTLIVCSRDYQQKKIRGAAIMFGADEENNQVNGYISESS